MNEATFAEKSITPEQALGEFWAELHAEAEVQFDRRVELLGPIETADDAAFRKALSDGWSAWLLAKKIIDNRHNAILADKQEGTDIQDAIYDVFPEARKKLLVKAAERATSVAHFKMLAEASGVLESNLLKVLKLPEGHENLAWRRLYAVAYRGI